MKQLLIISILFGFLSCSQNIESTYSWDKLNVSGEFLFEGPNSLQGQIGSPIAEIAEKNGIDPSKISAIYISNCSVNLSSDELRKDIENMLVQLVSDKLNLISVATINGIPESGEISLSTSTDQNVLEYIQDPNTTLVLDANLKRDMDDLSCMVNFELKIIYEN